MTNSGAARPEYLLTEEFIRFIVEAKKSAYASGKNAEILPDGKKRFAFQDGIYLYTDIFETASYGPDDGKPVEAFFGRERAHIEGNPIWGMEYFGATNKNNGTWIPAAEINAFLRKALREGEYEKEMEFEDMPLRGPKKMESEDFIYVNQLQGTMACFLGIERIFYKKVFPEAMVHEMKYTGGILLK